MKRIFASEIPLHVGSIVHVCGWIDAIRDHSNVAFVVIRDRTGTVQTVFDKSDSAILEAFLPLTRGSMLSVVGQVNETSTRKGVVVEIAVSGTTDVSLAQTPIPIETESSLEHQMDWRYLSLRTPENLLIFRVQTTMERAMRSFWEQKGFIEIHSPKLMGTSSESGAELFSLDYFGNKKAFLAQSPQFYKQMAMAAGFDRVFEVGPVFRANPSFTSRHDTEFTSVDMEISWIVSHEEVMTMEEEWIVHVMTEIAATHGDEIRRLFKQEVVIPSLPFPRISLDEARTILAEGGHLIDHKADLDPEGERRLYAYIHEKFDHEFVFVTDYPSSVRAFYHMRYPDRPDVTKSFDLLWKGLEITTGAQREHRIDKLIQQAEEKGYNLDPLSDYLGFFRYGMPPHGGCGIGLTRMLMILMGRMNVREVTFLYRGPNRLTP
jgi:nondiscriminating aspartyl-tRNA synthetase